MASLWRLFQNLFPTLQVILLMVSRDILILVEATGRSLDSGMMGQPRAITSAKCHRLAMMYQTAHTEGEASHRRALREYLQKKDFLRQCRNISRFLEVSDPQLKQSNLDTRLHEQGNGSSVMVRDQETARRDNQRYNHLVSVTQSTVMPTTSNGIETTTELLIPFSRLKKAKLAARKAERKRLKQIEKQKAKALRDKQQRNSRVQDEGRPSENEHTKNLGSRESPKFSKGGIFQTTFLASMEDLHSKVASLESTVLEEMVSNRELRTTIMLQEQLIKRLNYSMTSRGDAYKRLEFEFGELRDSSSRQREYQRSIDNKLAGVMLDVAEVNNMLSEKTDQRKIRKELENKMIAVESASEKSQCSVPPNVTRYKGKVLLNTWN